MTEETGTYPFRYVGVLFPQFRERAMKDIEFHREEIASACAFFVSRATKAEFMVWVREIWEQTSDEWNDYIAFLLVQMGITNKLDSYAQKRRSARKKNGASW